MPQLTLAIIKPDILRKDAIKHSTNEILSTIKREGFKIVKQGAARQLSKEDAEKFYGEHKGKFFYQRLVSFMTSGPLVPLILQRENAIQHWRYLLGPTHIEKARATRIKLTDVPTSPTSPTPSPTSTPSTTPPTTFAAANADISSLCLRGLYATSDTKNAFHGSDSETTAAKEIQFFFPEFSSSDVAGTPQ